jgi:aminopeptidase N
MWGEHEGFFTPQDVYDDLTSIPADDGFWDLPIGDPGIANIFAGQIYDRGALTLHALRLKVGDKKFFQILRAWVAQQAGGTVSTREFIDVAESIYKKDLDPLFAEWLSAGKPASLAGHGNPNARGSGAKQKTVSGHLAKEKAGKGR